MKWEIEKKQTHDLIITVEAKERELLRANENDSAFDTDRYMWDFLEPIWTNGLCTCDPADVGASTSAPMLCEGLADDGKPSGRVWAYMNYQVRSPLKDLLETGRCRWTYGGVSVARVWDVITLLQDEGAILRVDKDKLAECLEKLGDKQISFKQEKDHKNNG